ncbi:MAG: phosphatase PAP2 family protein [Candidatus Helarchaeota archaeon]
MNLNKIQNWDRKYCLKINNYDNRILTIFFKIISFFGRETIYFLIIATFIFVYYWRAAFIGFGLCLMYGLGICYILKVIVNRKRPFQSELLKEKIKIREKIGHSASFPSWHTYNILSQTIMTYFIFQNSLILIFGIPISIILGISRIYLGQHYPTDVIFGILFGILGCLLAILTFNWWYSIVQVVEELAGFGKQEDQIINSFFRFPWYIILVISIYACIIFSAIFKYIFHSGNKK